MGDKWKDSLARRLWNGIIGLMIFLSIAIPLFWLVHMERCKMQLLLMFAILVLDFCFVKWILHKRAGKVLSVFVGVSWAVVGVLVAVLALCSQPLGEYKGAAVTTSFFSGKNVMVIVPHQDDEVNLVHGIVEQYVRNGSQVSIVFATNGDYLGKEEIRFREALDVASYMGVPEENVYFLGFGDNWEPMTVGDQEVAHIYHSPKKEAVWTSHHGKQGTYGTQAHDCYETVAYTRENYVNSLLKIIEELRPDVIYANDFDAQVDHRSLSLLVDEAMCRILAGDNGYRPELFKGYCYRTAWYGIFDFEGELNIRSSREYLDPKIPEVELPYYPWQERIRIPVWVGGLNRFITHTDGYHILSVYASQYGRNQAPRIVNGDKVFWKRSTDSLLYQAEIQMEGTPATILNDFKLSDSSDINKQILDCGIQQITAPISVSLPQAVEMEALALYDDYHADSQILGGRVILDNGTQVEFGALNDNGTPTIIPIPKQSVQAFTVHVDSFRGAAPGLTEIEAYGENPANMERDLEYMLFTDAKDDIVYDYYVDTPDGKSVLTLYTYPRDLDLRDEDFVIKMAGSRRCGYTFHSGILTVTCPKMASCEITVNYGDTSCQMSFSNPGPVERWLMKSLQSFDYYLAYDENPLGIQDQISYYGSMVEKIREVAHKIMN